MIQCTFGTTFKANVRALDNYIRVILRYMYIVNIIMVNAYNFRGSNGFNFRGCN